MFGSDGSPIVQYVSIFAVIFAVLAVIVLVVRRLGGGGLADARRAGQRGRQPRLGIVDVYELDRQRQLILLRRDNVEHLLLVGGPNDVVIERHIQRGQRDAAMRPEAMAEPHQDLLADAFPESLVAPFVPPTGEPAIAVDARRPPPNVEMPAAAASSAPGPSVASSMAVSPEAPARDAADAIVPGIRSETSTRRPMRRTTPPLVNPRPDVASERSKPEPTPAVPAFVAEAVPAPADRPPVDPAILSDMARQLEAALARPASAVTTPPAPRLASPAAVAPARKPDPGLAVDPMAAAMAAAPSIPDAHADEVVFGEPERPAPFLPEPPRPRSPGTPDPAPVPQPAAAPAAERPEVVPKAEKAPEPPPAPQTPKSAANPFSVEEIEAEFARLLGRPLDKRS